MNMLRLESFTPAPLPVAVPGPTAEDVADALARGHAEGRALGRAEAGAAVAEALAQVSAALAMDAARRAEAATLWRRQLGVALRAVLAQVAPRARLPMLAERIVDTLAAVAAAQGTPPGASIACEPALAAQLRLALEDSGLDGVQVGERPGPVEVQIDHGVLRLDPDDLEARIAQIIDDMEQEEAE